MRDRAIMMCRNTGVMDIVGEASTAKETFALIEQLQPDLLLMDVQLLEGNGVEIARKLKADGSPVKVILQTSMGQGGSSGVEFPKVIKPFHAEQLRVHLYQLFGERALRSA
jgi:response regulator of citrate/malate metabolism